jgi:hypothetical protein
MSATVRWSSRHATIRCNPSRLGLGQISSVIAGSEPSARHGDRVAGACSGFAAGDALASKLFRVGVLTAEGVAMRWLPEVAISYVRREAGAGDPPVRRACTNPRWS